MGPAPKDRVGEQEEARAPAGGTVKIPLIRGAKAGVAVLAGEKAVAVAEVKDKVVVLDREKETLKSNE